MMEAKDTVMNDSKLFTELRDAFLGLDADDVDWDLIKIAKKAQAEISFKAGQEEQPRTPRTDLENKLADKEFAKLYRKARIKTQREIDLCLEAHKAGIEEEAKGGTNAISYLKGVQEGTQKGMQKVVEWIDSLPNWGGQNTVTGKFFVKGKLLPITDWQAFKKERGL